MKKKKLEDKFIEELQRLPIISLACKNTGISRNSIYRWKKNDKKFRKKVEDSLSLGIDNINDLAESKIIQGIQSGDFKYSKFWLESRHKNYIKPRKPINPINKYIEDEEVTEVNINIVTDREKGRKIKEEQDKKQKGF